MTQYLIGIVTTGVIISIVSLALNVRWGWAGEFDVALFAFVAIGAYTYSVFSLPPADLPPPGDYVLGLSAPFLVSVVAAVIVSGVLSLVVGAIALKRLRDDYFGITTLAFALILALFIGQYTPLFDGYEGVYGMPQPLENLQPFGANGGNFLALCVLFLVLAYWMLARLFKSPFGRALRSVREDDKASQAFSRNVYWLKIKGYVLGGCLAGLGGALLAAYITSFNPYAWTPEETFLVYASIFIGGTGNSLGAISGTFFVWVAIQEGTRYIPQIGNGSLGDALRLICIGLLIVAILWFRPQGIIPERRDRDRIPRAARVGRWGTPANSTAASDLAGIEAGLALAGGVPGLGAPTRIAVNTPPAHSPAISPVFSPPSSRTAPPDVLLEVRGATKAFGGVQAVSGASFTVGRGSLTGLIGPNGAGKSTMINLISGFESVDSGSILFDGKHVEGKPAHSISQLGLMRSFQTPREWAGLTVMENMLLATPINGRESVWRGLFTPHRLGVLENRDRALARDLLDQFGLLGLKDELAGNLSGGQKRLLEFARLAAARPRMVLLDEPQAGVNPVLGDRMAELIRNMVESGMTVLLVEHNLGFIEKLCDRVLVMALGKCIADGTMSEIQADQNVVDAYLGLEEPSDA